MPNTLPHKHLRSQCHLVAFPARNAVRYPISTAKGAVWHGVGPHLHLMPYLARYLAPWHLPHCFQGATQYNHRSLKRAETDQSVSHVWGCGDHRGWLPGYREGRVGLPDTCTAAKYVIPNNGVYKWRPTTLFHPSFNGALVTVLRELDNQIDDPKPTDHTISPRKRMV